MREYFYDLASIFFARMADVFDHLKNLCVNESLRNLSRWSRARAARRNKEFYAQHREYENE